MTTRPEALSTNQPSPTTVSVWRRLLDPVAVAALQTRGALGRYLSVRWKLTLWYGFMCAVALSAVGFGVRAAFDYQINSSVDSNLADTYRSVQPVLSSNASIVPPSTDPQAKSFCTNRQLGNNITAPNLLAYCVGLREQLDNNLWQVAPGQFEEIYLSNQSEVSAQTGPSAETVYQSAVVFPRYAAHSFFQGQMQPSVFVPVEVQTSANNGHPAYGTTQCVTRHGAEKNNVTVRCRVYARLLPVPNDLPQGTKALLEVFQRLDTFDTVQQQMDGILVIATFVALVIALAAGWWIARAALRPINRIARTVRAIGDSRDLSRRLNFVGPYDEVGRLAETFDDMMDRLQRAFEAQTRFIADASHELRTPLTAIRGNADLIAKAPPEERDQCVRSIRREAERMSRLVSDLLLLAEADAEQQSIHKAEIDLDDVLSEVHRSALVLAAGRVDVRYESAEPIALFADLDRLKQVFLNLVDNAVKFTPPGGVVTIAAARDERGARISVSDTGTGIPLEEQEAIFRRFYRLEESRSQRGSGLGLSISAWIVAAHQGTIDIESKPGRGTTFTVHLPGVLDTVRAERSPAQPA